MHQSWIDSSRISNVSETARDVKDSEIIRDLNILEEDNNVKHGFVLAFYFLLRSLHGCTFQ